MKKGVTPSPRHPKAGWHPAELPRRKMNGTGKARDVDVRNANEMRTVEEAKRRLKGKSGRWYRPEKKENRHDAGVMNKVLTNIKTKF